MSELLNLQRHFKVVKEEVRIGLASLKKMKDPAQQKELDEVYHALLESHLRHINFIWGCIPTILDKRL